MREFWGGLRRACFAATAIAAACAWGATPAAAQIGSDRYASIVLDARSGNILSAASPDEARYPASLTKMMTLYMLFEAIRDGRIGLDSRLVMSSEAASRPPSKLGIPPGVSITVEQAIMALVTKSANDIASLLGETLGGTEERFGQMMTLRARALGMSRTTFRNASGLPDLEQMTTARDMATLGRRLYLDFPDRYHYFATTTARIGRIALRNHNRMLGEYDGVDGIKTGYITASGFNIVTSAQRQGQRVVAAVFGGSSWVERDRHAAMLLDEGFSRLGVAPSAPTLPTLVAARGAQMAGRAAAATLPAPVPVNRRAARAANAARSSGRVPGSAGPVRATAVRPGAPVRAAQPVRTAGRGGRIVEQGDGGPAARAARQAARQPAARQAKPVVRQVTTTTSRGTGTRVAGR
ncbi:D-alanyl-D-alanine carboxypeptidase [Roseomonas sp. OT10]|uniref:D-alanyl-D-alanine carboxypeptidase family protein n=1 Tax=Roseomonas cutis TaxID=2897332 RepID=UPI001E4183AF|nr:D-alanyl-D-alanine carboxypeptidase family protein [Roseomonas sp. OT10]UFN51162.1 D-alanyl-D-alanine carboxypeptidase [Roseomonas sp. OT10]